MSSAIRCCICGKKYASKYVVDVFGVYVCIFCFGSDRLRIERGPSRPPIVNKKGHVFLYSSILPDVDLTECKELLCGSEYAELDICKPKENRVFELSGKDHISTVSPIDMDNVGNYEGESFSDRLIKAIQEDIMKAFSDLNDKLRRIIREAFNG